ncbi:hypothetical protein M514_20054 [Trichuris suis]|uniref:Uncharacterized protein n=1 Tax=Trichuris suis TaxID=68888 RepID=A0A085NE63_9BILA|nr:hypothetical protein M514_20054 [Trichuris suis]
MSRRWTASAACSALLRHLPVPTYLCSVLCLPVWTYLLSSSYLPVPDWVSPLLTYLLSPSYLPVPTYLLSPSYLPVPTYLYPLLSSVHTYLFPFSSASSRTRLDQLTWRAKVYTLKYLKSAQSERKSSENVQRQAMG